VDAVQRADLADLRIAAADAAGYRVLAPLLPALDEVLARDRADAVRAATVLRLAARLRDTPALRPLLERAAANDSAAQVREAARRALAT